MCVYLVAFARVTNNSNISVSYNTKAYFLLTLRGGFSPINFCSCNGSVSSVFSIRPPYYGSNFYLEYAILRARKNKQETKLNHGILVKASALTWHTLCSLRLHWPSPPTGQEKICHPNSGMASYTTKTSMYKLLGKVRVSCFEQ